MTSATFPAFAYQGDTLHCEGVSLVSLAEAVGTPTYVYSRGAIEAAYRAYDAALAGIDHLICYSVKANSSLGILDVLARLGAGADIVSAGELHRWIAAGGDPAKVVFSGVGKTEAEMRDALAAGIGAFNVESTEELEVLDQVARAAGVRARVALRVNPDVDAQTHPYISTGLTQNKFGIAAAAARDAFRRAADLPGLEVRGIDCHIGSQLTKTSPFSDAIARLCELILTLAGEGIVLSDLDIGGGLGIDYGKDGDPPPPSHGEYGAAVKQALAALGDHPIRLLVEPGRSIVGPAGVLLTRVLYNKDNEVKHFTIVDAAMNDLMRPSFYGSHHPMRPVRATSAAPRTTDVVGPICETGDFLARDRALPPLARGELLAIGAAGAYGFTMSSNYNTRPRAAEVLVAGERWTVIRERETLEHLLRGERTAG
ncbi:MAG: diaminopimelate decarboxylase [Kofleriaceae bacterium]|nr:diaminopimelate decarboxylase [Kofleriaceae bacterium]MCL4224294.1 diaminopimelate decarboxylase [Myxococcales bacterium]